MKLDFRMTSAIFGLLFLLINPVLAVNISTDNLGQVLLVPYYNVENYNETFISITNTTDRAKAVRINIREAENSRAVLSLNIYLSAHDFWNGKIRSDAGGGAQFITADQTCTVPALPFGTGVPFRSYAYIDDGGDTSVARTREGHIEFIEMGIIESNSVEEIALTHVDGIPSDCSLLNDNWFLGGKWSIDPQASMEPPIGGLKGAANIINIAAGTEYEMPITVLQNFYVGTDSLHTAPGELPNLSSATPQSTILIETASATPILSDQWGAGNGLQAVSAALMAAVVTNNFTVNPAVEYESSWVVTFPTKGLHTDPIPTIPPFTSDFGTSGACESLVANSWDREETSDTDSSLAELCYAVNVINFGSSDVLSALRTTADFTVSSPAGWAKLQLPQHMATPLGFVYNGLPAIGFSVVRAKNSIIGSAAAYSMVSPHSTQSIKDTQRVYCGDNSCDTGSIIYTSGENYTYISQDRISTNNNEVTISQGALVVYMAPIVELGANFRVVGGSRLAVRTQF